MYRAPSSRQTVVCGDRWVTFTWEPDECRWFARPVDEGAGVVFIRERPFPEWVAEALDDLHAHMLPRIGAIRTWLRSRFGDVDASVHVFQTELRATDGRLAPRLDFEARVESEAVLHRLVYSATFSGTVIDHAAPHEPLSGDDPW